MHLTGETWIFLLVLKFLAGQRVQTRLFKFDPNVNIILPLPSKAISSISQTSQLRCARACLSVRLCEGFLFNSNTAECKLARCSVQGLKISPYHVGWNYFGNTKECCEDGWTPYINHCYRYNDTHLTWDNAKIACEDQNSYLMQLETAEETSWVLTNLLPEVEPVDPDDNRTWQGATDRQAEGNFTWSAGDGGDIYPYWNPGQPDNFNDGQDCLTVMRSGRFDDSSCADRKTFVCEKHQ